MRNICIILICLINLYSNDFKMQQQEIVLRVQTLIEQEEKIAENFEKYLLTEFSFPTMENLVVDSYLGSNFSLLNNFGSSNIAFQTEAGTTNRLEIKYAVTNNVESFIKELYDRDLYRFKTYIKRDGDSKTLQIKLKSKEALNIYEILKSGATIAKTCSDNLKNSYCNYDIGAIRWYNSASNWIEYSKKDFEDGNVTIVSSSVLNDVKLNNLKVGSYIFIENSAKYVKIIDNKILKVE
jgi:hypothetical protein